MSRKRVPLNQNECTANFRIGVPFEQNLQFAALDENHSSQVYSLYEIRREDNERVNNTAAYDKQYLEGRYGADPYLQNMLSGGEWI